MKEAELKPCPFCGGNDLELKDYTENIYGFWDYKIRCKTCRASMDSPSTAEVTVYDGHMRQRRNDETKAKAKRELILNWNRRTRTMAKIKPLRKKHRFTRWLKSLLGIQSPGARACGFRDIDEMHTYKPKVVLKYTEEEAALLYDLLSSEMDELMHLNTENRLSEEPIFDQEQTEYLHRAMQFCAEQMKVLSKYAPVGGANDVT